MRRELGERRKREEYRREKWDDQFQEFSLLRFSIFTSEQFMQFDVVWVG